MHRRRKAKQPVSCRKCRRGAAAVECAMVSPLLVLIVLGAIDIGQFLNVSQVVDNSAREGARKAIRSSTTSVADVESVVESYLGDYFPGVSSSDIASATAVTVYDEAGKYRLREQPRIGGVRFPDQSRGHVSI